MNQKGISNTRYTIMVALFIALFFAVSIGCATRGGGLRNMTGVSRYFDKDVNTVWDAITQAVEGGRIKTKDKGSGVVTTQWVKGWSTKKTTGLLLEGQWQERYRLLIKITGEQNKTYVSVNAQIEEKPPGGSQAYRWSRITSDGTLEREFLQKVENILGSM